MNKRLFSLILLIVSLTLLFSSFKLTLTGYSIFSSNLNMNSIGIFSLIIFFLSLFVLISKQGLDAILVPTGSLDADQRRAKKAAEYRGNNGLLYLVSGAVGTKEETSQPRGIYNRLVSEGVQPQRIHIEGRARNTVENVLYSLKMLKRYGAKEIGIASNPTHLWRFIDIAERAKEEGLIDPSFKIYPLKTDETLREGIYGVLAYLEYLFLTRIAGYKLRETAKKNMPPLFIKRILSRQIFARKS